MFRVKVSPGKEGESQEKGMRDFNCGNKIKPKEAIKMKRTMKKAVFVFGMLAICTGGVLSLGISSAEAGSYYARPPYNIKLSWPSNEWEFTLHDEEKELSLIAMKDSGEDEGAVIVMQGLPMDGLGGSEVLDIFHLAMEIDYREDWSDFRRLSRIYRTSVGGQEALREEFTHLVKGKKVKGSMISFEKEEIFYWLVFISSEGEYFFQKEDFEEVLESIEFTKIDESLLGYLPKEVLGHKLPIIEVSSEAPEGLAQIESQIVGRWEDRKHKVLIMVYDFASPSDIRLFTEVFKEVMKGIIEKGYGVINWEEGRESIYGMQIEYAETEVQVRGGMLYAGIGSWSIEDLLFVVLVEGPVREDYSHENLVTVAKTTIAKNGEKISLSSNNKSQDDASFFKERGEAAFRGMDALVDERTGLPVDIATITTEKEIELKDYKTSPTNIGLRIVTVVAEYDQGIISEEKAEGELLKIVGTLEKMEKYKGFFYNWYNLAALDENGAPKIGAPGVAEKAQRFISSVDNGNLTATMMVAIGAFPGSEVAQRFQTLLDNQDYNFFYREDWREWSFINHGYYVDKRERSPFDYGTFMTEARLLVFIATLKDKVPEVWYYMSEFGAEPTLYEKKNGGKVVVIASWGGSLFEELFPDLFLDEEKNAPGTLGENHRRAVQIHIDNADSETGLWGWSPSENVEGVYKEAGVPYLGIGGLYPRGDISIYSIFLATRYAPEKGIETLKEMEKLNSDVYHKDFGYRDAISKDGKKVGPNLLALDKGMEAVALYNLYQETQGKEGISKFFWKYLDSIDKKEECLGLLSELEFDDRFYTYEESTIVSQDKPIDVFEVFSKWGVGGGAGGKMERTEDWRWVYSPPRILRYDVTPSDSFAYYTSISINSAGYRRSVDISNYNGLTIRFRGGEEFPASFKIELKSRARLVKTYLVEDVTQSWQTVSFPLYGDFLGSIDEIVITFEHRKAKKENEGNLVGTLYIDKIELTSIAA